MNKNIFVFVEQKHGNIQKVAFELIGKASELARELEEKVIAVLPGYQVKEKAQELIAAGADKVLIADDEALKYYDTEAYTKVMETVIEEMKPEILFFGATAIGRDLAPRVSARVKTGLTADCTKLEIDQETKKLHMTRPAFGGNIMATIVCPNHFPQMATVRPGVMKANVPDSSRSGEVEMLNIDFSSLTKKVEILEVVTEENKSVDISEAKIIVACGRGVGGEEGVAKAQAVCEQLNGQIAGSRASIEEGWIDSALQVGQTGKTVRPELYLACGISGAIQHLAGMEESELIIAINKNPNAPIFEVADLGIVGDVHKVLPELENALKARNC